jgi:hypothetical protein
MLLPANEISILKASESDNFCSAFGITPNLLLGEHRERILGIRGS